MKTKKLIYLLAVCFVSSIFIIQTGCKKDKDEEPPPSNLPVLSANAKILDETAWVESFVSMDSSNYTYTFNTNINSLNLAVGDLLASNAGNGCLRIVKSVTSAKGEVVVETEQGSMEDLFESGEVILDTPLDIEDIESVNFNYPGIKLIPNNLKQPDDLGFTIEFDIIFKGDTANPSGLVRIHGSSTFNFGLITQINYSVLSGLTYVKVGFESSQVLTLDFIAGVGYNEEINLGEVLFKKK